MTAISFAIFMLCVIYPMIFAALIFYVASVRNEQKEKLENLSLDIYSLKYNAAEKETPPDPVIKPKKFVSYELEYVYFKGNNVIHCIREDAEYIALYKRFDDGTVEHVHDYTINYLIPKP